MKLLFDFLPILLFFASFRYAESHKDWAAALANDQLAGLMPGGTVGVDQAPVLLATLVVIVATIAQVLWLKARGKRVDTMLWVSLALIVVLGSATIYFRNENFIKWKPTLLYWAMGLAFWLSPLLFGKNLLRALLGEQFQAPAFVWRNLNFAWIAFFSLMGLVNLWVAFSFSLDTWVSYKLFGGLGLFLAFSVAQAFYLVRYAKDEVSTSEIASKTASEKPSSP